MSSAGGLLPVHFSTLKHFGRSPAHYLSALALGVTETKAMRVGTLVHAETFEQDGPLVYEGERRGNAWKAFKEENPGVEIVTRAEADRAREITDALRLSVLAHHTASGLLSGRIEQTIEWPLLGRACQGTPDVVGTDSDGLFLTDLKTTADAHPAHFQRFALKMGYHAQLAWYMDGVRLAGLGDPRRGFIVAVEQKPPYVVTCFELTAEALEMGRRQYRLWMEQLLVCEASGIWPGYCQSIVPLDAPDEETELLIDGETVAA